MAAFVMFAVWFGYKNFNQIQTESVESDDIEDTIVGKYSGGVIDFGVVDSLW